MNRQTTGTASSSTLPKQRLRKSPASSPATSPLIKIKASNWDPTINAANTVVATQHRNTLNSSTLLSFCFKPWESVAQPVAQQVSLHRYIVLIKTDPTVGPDAPQQCIQTASSNTENLPEIIDGIR